MAEDYFYDTNGKFKFLVSKTYEDSKVISIDITYEEIERVRWVRDED